MYKYGNGWLIVRYTVTKGGTLNQLNLQKSWLTKPSLILWPYFSSDLSTGFQPVEYVAEKKTFLKIAWDKAYINVQTRYVHISSSLYIFKGKWIMLHPGNSCHKSYNFPLGKIIIIKNQFLEGGKEKGKFKRGVWSLIREKKMMYPGMH